LTSHFLYIVIFLVVTRFARFLFLIKREYFRSHFSPKKISFKPGRGRIKVYATVIEVREYNHEGYYYIIFCKWKDKKGHKYKFQSQKISDPGISYLNYGDKVAVYISKANPKLYVVDDEDIIKKHF